MPITPQDYNNDAVNGAQLKIALKKEIENRYKGDQPETLVVALVDIAARVQSLEAALASANIGDVTADSLDAQSLKVGGVDVKAEQSAVDVSGSTVKTLTRIQQDKHGKVTPTFSDIRSGTTQQSGIVQLLDSHTSTATDKAATPKSVKEAYELANSKYSKPVDGIPKSHMDSEVQSCLLPNSDVFVATYPDNEDSSGTPFNDLVAARNAGKKLYLLMGGNVAGTGESTYEILIPLTYCAYNSNSEIVSFVFEWLDDGVDADSNKGTILRYTRTSGGWAYNYRNVHYAETAGAANTAASCTGNAVTATNATHDGNGSNIADTYAKKQSFKLYEEHTNNSLQQNSTFQLSTKYNGTQPHVLNKPMIFDAEINFTDLTFDGGVDVGVIKLQLYNSEQATSQEPYGQLLFERSVYVRAGNSTVHIQMPFTWGSGSSVGSFSATLYGHRQTVITGGSSSCLCFYYSIST